MVYTSKEKEVNTVPLIHALFRQKTRLLWPIIVKEDVSLRLSYLRDFSALVPSTFGVPEPIGTKFPAALQRILARLYSRLLGFDRTGGRIGYGAGYYDRFLSKHPNLRKVGIAFACQEVGNLPVDENDIRYGHYHNRGWHCVSGRGVRDGDQRTGILDTFAEAFQIWLSRVIITASNRGMGV